MSYKVEVQTDNGINWASNGLRFAETWEAEGYGADLAMRWTSVLEFRVTASDDPVNYRWTALGVERIEADSAPR